MAIVLIIALIIFGPRKLPELGRSMGRGIRECKGSLTGDDADDDEEARRAELEQQSSKTDAKADEESVEGEVVGQRRS